MEKIQFVSRRGTDCCKWDRLDSSFSRNDLTGLWVADMDFRTADCVIEALRRAVDTGVFGYDHVPEGYYEALTDWEKRYHGYAVEKEWIRYSPGVVPAFNWLMCANSQPGDSVLVLSPCYYPMLDAPVNNGRKLVTSALVCRDGQYTVNWSDFEAKLRENDVKVFILCSPHNPLGRVWTEEELRRMVELCRKYRVFIISDEIHGDIVFAPHRHIPTATLAGEEDRIATLIAPSKTFNLAGMKNSAVILPREDMRLAFDDFTKRIRISSGNTLGYVAAEAAYRGGREWLEQVLSLIRENGELVRSLLTREIPGIRIPELQGTYLLWLDFTDVLKEGQAVEFFEDRCRLAMDYGDWFGGDKRCVRMNLATSREIIRSAAETIVREYHSEHP